MRRWCTLAAVASLLVLPAPARGAPVPSALDPKAPLFTLVWPRDQDLNEFRLPPQGGFADGSVLLGSSRLWLDGSVTANPFGGEIVDTAGGILKRDGDLVLRLAPDADAAQPLVRIGRYWSELVLLDDGRLVFAKTGLHWVETNGAIREIPGGHFDAYQLAPIAGGRFAASTADALMLVEAGGSSRRLVTRPCCSVLSPLRDGRVLAANPNVKSSFDLIAPDGNVATVRSPASRVYGNGDGVPMKRQASRLTQAILSLGMVHAADGSLLFIDDVTQPKVRAFVPSGSPRPRVALRQSAFRTFPQRRLPYIAPIPGRLELEVLSRGRVADRVTAQAVEPKGELVLHHRPRSQAYDLRLRLHTAGGIAETRATIDLRLALPRREGVARIRDTYAFEHRETGLRTGTAAGPCSRPSTLAVSCRIALFERSAVLDGTRDGQRVHQPIGVASATLGRDGVRTTVDARVRQPPPRERYGTAAPGGEASVSRRDRATKPRDRHSGLTCARAAGTDHGACQVSRAGTERVGWTAASTAYVEGSSGARETHGPGLGADPRRPFVDATDARSHTGCFRAVMAPIATPP